MSKYSIAPWSFAHTPSRLTKVILCRKSGAPYEVMADTRTSTPIDKDWKACSPNRPTTSQDSPCGFNIVTPTAIAHNSNDVRCDRPS